MMERMIERLETRRLLATTDLPNDPFLTDAELTDYTSMDVVEIREFLADQGSYFRVPRTDVDGVTFDAAGVIADAAEFYEINPQVILATLQKEHSGITRSSRPTESQMAFLMGCRFPTTAREQLFCSAERFRSYHDDLLSGQSTISGWRQGVAKRTLDDVNVTPATFATAGQFTYTPYAGVRWGGDLNQVGGVYLFANSWDIFGFDVPIPPEVTATSFNAPGTITFTFSEDVSASLSAGDLDLFNTTTGQNVTGLSLSVSDDGRTATWRHPSRLPNGDYVATLPANSVRDVGFNTLDADATQTFAFLHGDVDRNRFVNLFDLFAIRSSIGTANPDYYAGDVNSDDFVNIFDFFEVRSHLGDTLD